MSFDQIFLEPFPESVDTAKPAAVNDATNACQPEDDVSTETEVTDGIEN